jgi:serine protease Do
LIGINSQILAGGPSGGNIGIGFSIPSNMAKSVMEQLLTNGKVSRGMLGVNIQTLTEDTAKALDLKDVTGVLVSTVRSGSAAEKAGVKRGDIITAINGEKIDDGNVLRNKVASTTPGSTMKLTVLRDGETHELTATLDEFDLEASGANPQSQQDGPSIEKQSKSGKLGLTLQSVTPEIAKQLKLASENEGVVVTEVDQSGVGADAGIGRGDVILEVNRQIVNSPEAVQAALDKAGDKPILLLLSRRGQTIYMTVRP